MQQKQNRSLEGRSTDSKRANVQGHSRQFDPQTISEHEIEKYTRIELTKQLQEMVPCKILQTVSSLNVSGSKRKAVASSEPSQNNV